MADVRSQMSDFLFIATVQRTPVEKTLRYTEEFSVLFSAFSKGVLRTVAIKSLQIIANCLHLSYILHQTSDI